MVEVPTAEAKTVQEVQYEKMFDLIERIAEYVHRGNAMR
jgi:hypothetical protein